MAAGMGGPTNQGPSAQSEAEAGGMIANYSGDTSIPSGVRPNMSSHAEPKAKVLESFGWDRAFTSEYCDSDALVQCEEEALQTRCHKLPLAEIEPNQLRPHEAAESGVYVKASPRATAMDTLAWDRTFEADYNEFEALVPCEEHTPEKGRQDAYANCCRFLILGPLMKCPTPPSPPPMASATVPPVSTGSSTARTTASVARMVPVTSVGKSVAHGQQSARAGTSASSTHGSHTKGVTPPPKGQQQNQKKAKTQATPKQRPPSSQLITQSTIASTSKPPKAPVPSLFRQGTLGAPTATATNTTRAGIASKVPMLLSQRSSMIRKPTTSTTPKPASRTATISPTPRSPAEKTRTALPHPIGTMSKPKGTSQ